MVDESRLSQSANAFRRSPNRLHGEEPQEGLPSFAEATTLFLFILNLNIGSCANIFPKNQFTSLSSSSFSVISNEVDIQGVSVLSSYSTRAKMVRVLLCGFAQHKLQTFPLENEREKGKL